jgi:hypothetical protein
MSEQKEHPRVIKYASLQLNYVLHDQYKRLSDLPRITDSHEAVAYLQEHYRHFKQCSRILLQFYYSIERIDTRLEYNRPRKQALNDCRYFVYSNTFVIHWS